MGIPHIRQRLVFGVQCLENGLWDRSSLKRELLQKLPKSFDSITLLQENKQDWWFQLGGAIILLKQQQLSCRMSLVFALLNVAFGHRDPQTLHLLTSVCGDFLQKEPTATTQEA
jgi:hypothetical protein